MSKVREILKFKRDMNLSIRDIASATGGSKSAVADVMKRAKATGLTIDELLPLEDKALVAKLYPPAPLSREKVEPNLEHIYQELKKPNVTLMLLWEEYKSKNPDGLMYTQYCQRYRDFKKSNQITMHKEHKAGEDMEVDWAGKTLTYKDPITKTIKKAFIFVSVLPASSYPFVRAYENMKLKNWIDAHIRAFEFYGGTPKILIPDNTKTAVLKVDRYDPVLNRTYKEMAMHYNIAIIPARAGKPKDKGADEGMVKIVSQRILAALRNRQFFSLADINTAISEELEKLIMRPFQKIPGNRRDAFLAVDQPALAQLPSTRYEYAKWLDARVGSNYHVEYNDHFYSVLHIYSNEIVSLRVTDTTLEIFIGQERIQVHTIKENNPYDRYTTIPEHMPEKHLAVMNHPTEYYLQWADNIGPNAKRYIEEVLAQKDFPQEAHKACRSILRTCEGLPDTRSEKLFVEAHERGLFNYKYFKMLSRQYLEQEELASSDYEKIIKHDNIRGSGVHAEGDYHA